MKLAVIEPQSQPSPTAGLLQELQLDRILVKAAQQEE